MKGLIITNYIYKETINMEKKFEDVSKNILYTAVGAVVVVTEKTQQFLEECRIKGQEACEQYAIKNEELKRSAKEAFKKDVNVTVVSDDEDEKQPEETEDILSKIAKLSKEELSRVKEKLSELEKEEAPASEE